MVKTFFINRSATDILSDFSDAKGVEKEKASEDRSFCLRAEDGTQTRDPQLGRLMLYQLSYFRDVKSGGQ